MSKSLIVGILVGVAAGVGATLYWKSLQSSVVHEEPPHSASGSAPVLPPNPHGAGAAHGMPQGGPHGGDGHETSFAKVHFMRKFVAALTEAIASGPRGARAAARAHLNTPRARTRERAERR